MADPTVSLGLHVCGSITAYANALHCRKKDIASVQQQNESLRATLQLVEASLSMLRRDHHAAAMTTDKCLGSSKQTLVELEGLITGLAAYDKPTSSRSSTLKNQGSKLLYPFSRTKVEELETKIRNANSILQVALQTLELSVSHLSTTKLSMLETNLLVMQSDFLTMNENLEKLVTQLVVSQSTNPGNPQSVTSQLVPARLLAKPSLLRDIADGTDATSSNPSVDDVWVNNTGGRFSCLCRRRRQGRVKVKNVTWGPLLFSVEAATNQHVPGCPLAQVLTVIDGSQKMSVTYTGLRNLVNSAIQLSFNMTWGAGAWSLSPSFTYYPTVDQKTAPAFRMMNLLYRSLSSISLDDEDVEHNGLSYKIWLERLVPSATLAILRLFRAKLASPRAVNAQNESLVFSFINVVVANQYHSRQREDQPSHAEFSPLFELLQALLVSQIPANDYNLRGETPLHRLFTFLSDKILYQPFSKATAQLIIDSDAYMKPPFHQERSPLFATYLAIHLDLLASSTWIAEAYGCGPLSLAIISNEPEKVHKILSTYPATLAERNLYGYTPLHLAADKPRCLRYLVKPASSSLLNQTHRQGRNGISALDAAIMLSKDNCREPADGKMCRRCKCAECAVILMRAGCALPAYKDVNHVLGSASRRCTLRYIRYMKDRRDRLERLALANLTETEAEVLGLGSGRVLDSLAPDVIRLLRDRGIPIPEALSVTRHVPLSIYQLLLSPYHAELFYRAGFHDTDAWCVTQPAMLSSMDHRIRELSYLYWISTHGGMPWQLWLSGSVVTARDTLTIHFIFWKIGFHIYLTPALVSWCRWSGRRWPRLPSIGCVRAWVLELHHLVLPRSIADSCRCKCSKSGCTALTSLLKGLVGRFVSYQCSASGLKDELSVLIRRLVRYVEILGDQLIGDQLKTGHHAVALRYLTFTALGIPHTCCNPEQGSFWDRGEDNAPSRLWSSADDDDTTELQEEHVHGLTLLEELLAEFEPQVTATLGTPNRERYINFWETTWVNRMAQVLDDLQGSNLEDDERRKAEDIGVVWATAAKIGDNPYRKNSLNYWMYELEKIEAECR